MTAPSGPLATTPDGLRVVVTGASGGLGMAIVGHLLACRCQVAALDRFQLPDGLAGAKGLSFFPLDLADPEDVVVSVRRAADFLGKVDAVVLAAGLVDTLHRAESFPDDAWDLDLAVNLSGAFRAARACLPGLRAAEGGRIIVVSSTAGAEGQPAQVAYAAAKAGLVGMARTLAVEWARDGVICNVVMPGMTETPKVAGLAQQVREQMLRRSPLGRFASPAEIAGCVAFLLSPAAASINGAVLRVDGGAGLNQTALARGGDFRL